MGVLGPTMIRRDGEDLPPPPMMRRALLALLVLSDRRGAALESLVDGLWGETPPENVRNTLQVHVSGLRRILGAECIRTTPAGYRLADAVSCDADELENGLADALRERRNPSAVATALGSVLGLWRGQPLADVQAPFVERERSRLDDLHLNALEAYTDAELALGHHEQLVARLERTVTEHPLRELPWAQLITALHRGGRQADAMATYHRVRRLLRDELGADPGEAIQRAHADVLGSRPTAAPLPPTARPPTPRTALVGRARDVARVRERLADPNERMVSVIGPGGVGKTRLALEVARQEAETTRLHGGRVAWVPLASVPDADALPGWVAHTLGLDGARGGGAHETVIVTLAQRHLLLVLDNLEHLLPAAGQWLGALLDGCPKVMVLVTSRTATRVLGERRYLLDGLPVEDHGLQVSPASTLLLQCAEAVRPGWVKGQADLDAVNELAADLEGFPLSLELAAARAATLSPVALRDRLQARTVRLRAHGPDIDPRHRTLETTFAWSYDLLDPATRRTLDHLGAFRGVIPIDAAAAVTELPGNELLDRAAALVDASLLLATDHDPPAFAMLATIASCARELADREQLDAASARHARWYAGLAIRSADHLWARDQTDWFDLLEGDHANLRAALEVQLATAAEEALVMATNLAPFWEARGYHDEGLRWLLRTLEAAPDAAPAARAKAMFVGSRIAEQRGELDTAHELLSGSRDLYEQVGDLPGLVFAVSHLGGFASDRGDDETADAFGTRSIALARDLDDPWYTAMALNNHGYNRVQRDEVDEATAALLEESLSLRRDLGEPRGLAVTLASLAELHVLRGDLHAAESLLEEMTAQVNGLPHSEVACVGLNLRGFLHLFGGDRDAASATFGESLQQASDSGYRRTTVEAVLGLAAVAAARGLDTRALRLCSAAVADESPDGNRLTALHQRVVDGVHAQTAGVDDATRATVASAAREAPLDRIVAEALAGVTPTAPAR